ncbi:MAG: ammonia channel protein, partial [Thermomonas sp.]|nr:ammonia channel protein [Thermomonas sp.]
MRLPSIESRARIAAMLFLLFACGNLFAQDAAPAPTISKADTVWVLVSAALVIFMTLPGLALFYGG